MPKIDEWLSKARPEVIDVPLCLDRELLTEFDRCMREHDEAQKAKLHRAKMYGETKTLDGEEEDATAKRLAEVYEKIKADEKEHTFHFRKMARYKLREIVEAHPPTEDQKKQNPFLDHDPEDASPALVAESCFDPTMDEERAKELRDKLPGESWGKLYDAALRANGAGLDVPKDVRSSVETLAYELSLSSAAPTESPSPSSGGE